MIHVIIVEDEPAIARGLASLITRNYPDFDILATCRNGKEGLQKILEKKPDLVFVDINMPVMNGLEMISQMKALGFETRCIILTGYAEFEYARQALRLGISDYLLKPISPGTLNEILLSCQEQNRAATRILQREYLQRSLTVREFATESSNPLEGFSCTLMLLIFGPMCGNVYNETILSADVPQENRGLLEEIQEEYSVSLFVLPGQHYNESIYACVYPQGQAAPVKTIAHRLFEFYKTTDTFLHIIISETVPNGIKIFELVHNTCLYALFHNIFGCSGVLRYQTSRKDEAIHVSQEVKRICAGIPEQPGEKALYGYLHSILAYWEGQQVTQFQLVSDLRYFISTVIHDYTEENIIYPDAAEIVCTCHSYQELEREIQYELKRIYGFGEDSLHKEEQSLAHQVRGWLDKNFTTQITYKIFQDIFGHNEKYLSVLFKAEFGISPSKYIGELRLAMAKKLMQSNPDILLKDVAEMVGFTDAFYFSRVFKSHEGISPSAYVRRLKEEMDS
ncbi:response regulator [Blautia schinkii]|nr:response regulator [Blautia schinkii]